MYYLTEQGHGVFEDIQDMNKSPNVLVIRRNLFQYRIFFGRPLEQVHVGLRYWSTETKKYKPIGAAWIKRLSYDRTRFKKGYQTEFKEKIKENDGYLHKLLKDIETLYLPNSLKFIKEDLC